MVYEFPQVTDNSCDIAKAISLVLDAIYADGIRFYRCGVGAIELQSKQYQQADLFLTNNANPVHSVIFMLIPF